MIARVLLGMVGVLSWHLADTPTVPPPPFNPAQYVAECQQLSEAYNQYTQLEEQIRTLTGP